MKENIVGQDIKNFSMQQLENASNEEALSLTAKLKLIENAKPIGILTKQSTGKYTAKPIEDPVMLDMYANGFTKVLPKHYRNDIQAKEALITMLADACNPASSMQHAALKDYKAEGGYQRYHTKTHIKLGKQKQIFHTTYARVNGCVVEIDMWTDKDYHNKFDAGNRKKR